MNEEIKQRLLTYLDSVEGSIEKAVDFTSDQVPLYVQELCHYGAVSNAIPAVLILAAWLGLFIVAVAVNVAARNEKADDRWGCFGLTLFAFVVGSAFCGLGICKCGAEAYKAAYCPRVYVVEQIHELVK